MHCEIMELWIKYSVPAIAYLTVLFLLFLVLSNRYGLHERNREINIQAIVEEHYERYIEWEEGNTNTMTPYMYTRIR